VKAESWSVRLRNVIVTGGSRGLGLGIACKLSESGFRVIAIARKETDEFAIAKRKAEEIRPGSLHFVPFDLAEIDGIQDLAKNLRKDFGPLYGLVNNAGVSTDGTLALTSTQKIEEVVRLNTISPMVISKYVVRLMMADGGGRIVNISSIAALTGYSGLAVYAATKASLIGFTRSLAREVGRMGVNVNAVAPGFVETRMTEGMTAEQREQIKRRSALKRLVNVDDVANAVDFLVGDQSRNITGTVLTVDAGNAA
jgi:3-oxoacyl-[acyl-carrier protein] reductase